MSGRPDISQYGRTVYSVVYVAANRCAIIIRVMCYAVKVASPLTIFGISKGKFQRLQKISLYLLGRFQEKYQWAKNNSVQLGQNFQNPLPTNLDGSHNHTSVQIGQKLKSQLRHKLCRSQKSLLRNLQRSRSLTSTQVVYKLNLHHNKSKALTFLRLVPLLFIFWCMVNVLL